MQYVSLSSGLKNWKREVLLLSGKNLITVGMLQFVTLSKVLLCYILYVDTLLKLRAVKSHGFSIAKILTPSSAPPVGFSEKWWIKFELFAERLANFSLRLNLREHTLILNM